MKNITVKQIVKKYLQENGYDGLFNTEVECGCEINDLFPCSNEIKEECEAGYKVILTKENKKKFDSDDEFEVGDWVITRKKEK